jgi:hypothetical protein
MWYFAYGSNLNARAVNEWCRLHGRKGITIQGGKPAVLDNYRLGFSVYSEYWGGGIADIVYDPGKYVMGVLFDLSETDLDLLDRKVGRELSAAGKEVGTYERAEVKVAPLGKASPVVAMTYRGVNADRNHVPPTRHYMDLLVQGACSHGLSVMWLSYLQTFDTQEGRKPRPQALAARASERVGAWNPAVA